MAIQFLQQLAVDEATGTLFDAVAEKAIGLGAPATLPWASRPLTNLSPGATLRFSGIGRGNELWTWDGTRWVAPGVIVLAQASVPVPLTGTTVAQILASVTVPGGCMGPNGSIRVTLLGSMTNNANNKTWIIRYGGAATAYYLAGVSSAGGLAARVRIANRGATGSQVGPPNSISAEIGVFGAPQISSENSEVDQTVQVVGQLAVGTDTMTVESYLVELIP